jgi:phosphoribosylglycinamide formyltransferase-1
MPSASVPSATVPTQLVPSRNHSQRWQPRGAEPLRLLVLASGNGSNLQAILNHFRGSPRAEVVGVGSNHAEARALQRAESSGVATAAFPRDVYEDRQKRDDAMAQWIEGQGAELIVLAGYMEILTPSFVSKFRNRVINIHPSRLPRFQGLHAIERAHAAKTLWSGVTVHFVDEGVDTGPIIRQRRVWKRWHEGLGAFEERMHDTEHNLLPSVIDQIIIGQVKLGLEHSNELLRETRAEKASRYLRKLKSVSPRSEETGPPGPHESIARARPH